MGHSMLDSVSPFLSCPEVWAQRRKCQTEISRENFWGFMQHHWEHKLRAADCLTVTGDQLPLGESAIVISVSLATKGSASLRSGNDMADGYRRTTWRIPIITSFKLLQSEGGCWDVVDTL